MQSCGIYALKGCTYKWIKVGLKDLTSSLMGDVSKESCNLAFRLLGGTATELRVGVGSVEKSVSGVEALAWTVTRGLVEYATEEFCCHNVTHIV